MTGKLTTGMFRLASNSQSSACSAFQMLKLKKGATTAWLADPISPSFLLTIIGTGLSTGLVSLVCKD